MIYDTSLGPIHILHMQKIIFLPSPVVLYTLCVVPPPFVRTKKFIYFLYKD